MYRPPNKYYLLGIICTFSILLYSQNQTQPKERIRSIPLPEQHPLKETGNLPNHINEASGLAITSPNKFWTHNDDGIPVLFCIDSAGNLINSIHLNSINKGWEDLALDKHNNLYIGAFGNNTNDRKDLRILKITNPELMKTQMVAPEIINFTYEDQFSFPPRPTSKNFDADALIALDSSLYIFTKNRTVPFSGFTKIYRLPNQPGSFKAVLIDSVYLGGPAMMDFWVTGADISPDRSTLALLGHSSVWLITGFKGDKFSTGKITKLELGNYSHKAGISFYTNSQLYIVDEKEFGILGGKIYYLDLTEIVKKTPEH
ncbi:MAG: hypothetical protein J0L67_03160 [Cytophagales bacterium]|nr:hypothetical protein [Cytophagales bacterium]